MTDPASTVIEVAATARMAFEISARTNGRIAQWHPSVIFV
jgi:hypothetical protein